ncbi:hypothetical protein DFH09DRAFT_1326201 [Mycena vulgaris]|nr:hypothetical protein DFH09DRAFT_1326201 [Mycena vulgaris]
MFLSTQDDSEVLNTYGLIIYENNLGGFVDSVIYGIYVVLFIICMRQMIMRPLTSWATWSLLAAMCVLFVSTTLQLAVSIGFPMSQISGYLIATDVPLGERRDLWIAEHQTYQGLQYWPNAINWTISDIIVIWRAFVLSNGHRVVRGYLLLVMAADFFFWVYYSAVVTHHTIESGEYLGLQTDLKLGTAANYLSLGTNVVGTLCIAVKAWQHHKLMNATANKNLRNPSPVTRIMFILIETGAFFAALQLVTVVLAQVDLTAYTPLDYATTAITHAATLIAAVLPTATIIIVHSEHSVETWTVNRTPNPHNTEKTTRISSLRFGDNPNGSVPTNDESQIDSFDLSIEQHGWEVAESLQEKTNEHHNMV